MNIAKMVGLIFLSIYLILTGLVGMAEITMSPMASNFVQFLAAAAGVLIIISIGKYIPKKR